MYSKEKLVEMIRDASKQSPKAYLTYKCFNNHTGVRMSDVNKHFDSWSDACRAADVKHGESSLNIRPNFSKGKEFALSELKRIAIELNVNSISKKLFDAHNPEVRSCTVAKHFGGWVNALNEAGLESPSNYKKELPMELLAKEFLKVCVELQSVPTLVQLDRRSDFSKNSYSRKFGSYNAFKRLVIKYLLDNEKLEEPIGKLLLNHLYNIELKPKTLNKQSARSGCESMGFKLSFCS